MSDEDILRRDWQRMTEGLVRAGNVIETHLAGRSDLERADAYRAVLRALTANLGKIEADGRFPLPVHVNPPNQKWFLDNPDGVTVHCPLEDGQRYRLWGNLGAARYTSFITYEGKGDGLAAKATSTRTDRDIAVAPDGSFALTLSGETREDPSHIRLLPGTGQLWIRQLFDDIDRDVPGWFMIENLAPDSPPPLVSVEAVASGMKRIAKSIPTLTQMMFAAFRMQTEAHPANRIRVFREMQGGAFFTSDDVAYLIGSWRLEEGETLVVRGALPTCRHWNIVLYSPVLNSLEHRYRTTSLTGPKLVVNTRGEYEIAIGAIRPRDASNWLDTEGRPTGLFVIRVTGGEGETALPTATVVKESTSA